MSVWTHLLLMLFASSVIVGTPTRTEDEKSIRELLDELTEAYNRHDPGAMALLFEPDADTIAMGTYRGRAQIERFFSGLNGDPIDSPSNTASIRFLTDDVAIMDVDTFLPGLRGAEGKPLPNMLLQAFFVVQRKSERWRFSALRIRSFTSNPGQP